MRLIAFSFLILACGGDSTNNTTSTTGGTTGGAVDMAGPLSQCGHPGDTGNSKGVGAFCRHVNDCTGSANICSSLGNGPTPSSGDTYFCTVYPCTADAGTDATQCGEMATCVCMNGSGGVGGCACTPNKCL